MTQNKELEIQLQFLDEAQEYLGALETALLGLASSGVDIDRINAALRAAHSIKGGAGMMGFQTLSAMAHRLEDSFKVLKIQRHTIEIDGDLEGLLLTGVDCLRQVIECDRATLSTLSSTTQSPDYQGVNPQWLDQYANPIFEQLHDRLGDPEAEDANSMLSPEEGQDVIPMLFQTEVEGCLERLESVMAEHSPCLREEVDILAQELGGLGEMLQLPAFTELCGSVSQQITAASADRLEEVAALALQMWRRSQALVLTGNLEALPRLLDIAPDTNFDAAPDTAPDTIFEQTETNGEIAASWSDFDLFEGLTGAEDWTSAENWTDVEDWASAADSVTSDSATSETAASEAATSETATSETQSIPLEEPFSISIDALAEPESAETITVRSVRSTHRKAARQNTEFQVPEITLDPNTLKDSPENSVRVPSKQLDQLSDLFGELTIERNGLDLHLKRLRNLVQMLTQRVQTLDRSNAQLRNSYDRVSMQSSFGLPVLGFGATPQARLLIGSDESRLDEAYSANLGKFDTLEMDRYNEHHLMSQEVMETIVQIQEVSSDIEISLEDTEQTSRELRKTSRQLRAKLTQVRMRPLTDITDRFPRAIRELSLQHGKPVQIQIHGANTLVDRNILEALSDPLMHLLRNAFDHGIEDAQTRSDRGKPEQGLIEIRALHRNNRTIITLRDDGGGIPLDKVRAKARQMGLDEVLLTAATDEELLSLIFEPGFSTSDQVTALSGRGVGMDVVRDRLRQIQGEIKVDTQPGLGTTFTLSVPFTLSVARVLIAESHGMLMAFPIDAIEEMLLLPPEQVITTAGNEAFTWEDTMVQLIRLSQWLEFRRAYQPEGLETQASINVPTVLLLTQGSQLVGLQIDRNWGEQEVAIRKVEGGLPMPAGFSNCTILGDGRVVPLVNVPELLHWIASCERSQVDAVRLPNAHALPAALLPSEAVYGDRQPTVLVIDDSINVRRLLALTLEKAGYQVAQAKDGQDALDKLSAGLQVQVVICDIEMPRLDGYGFLAKVKASPPLERIPIAMLTSRSGEKHRQLAMSLGASAYFSKPYNEQALLQTLESLVELEAAI
ncbi:MAG: response regulator [Drouetiella hepatica Uher 2000/2452]|jgi:chemosensory pili system protein ChpA (sensor histidine kinase/response regulator)|uniref:histidine kinase n=1 Tax=Drouetiella hepatica Uher 2000/2452 TaxID=904376 RepID=A0A951Q6W0_9CYAN|nr:response regulator [Drouetiella hepatica Uher 2000/2452]